MTTHNRRLEAKSDKLRKEAFQNLLFAEFFGMRMIIVSNWLLSAACLASKEGDFTAQKLAARYYFTQFWAEFTVEVLHDFQVEDIEHRKQCVYRDEENEKRKRNDEKNNM